MAENHQGNQPSPASLRPSPLPLEVKLAGNPGLPKFGVEVMRSQAPKSLLCADPKITRAMIALMDMQAVLGGAASHWGGPAAFAEIMSALHALVFERAHSAGKQWHELFHLVNDGGHCENGIYALKANYEMAGLNINKLKMFRSIESVLTGHGEAHLFPEGVFLSNGPLGSALPQAQGLAAGDALAGRLSRVTVTTMTDGACMEGEAKEAFAAIPGWATRGKLSPFVLIISDNNTKLSGRIDDSAFSMRPTFESLAPLGWKYIYLEDGHNLKKCVEVIEAAINVTLANPKQPVVIHARTIKGFGVKSTESASSGGHGFPLKKPSDLDAFLNEVMAGASLPAELEKWKQELKSASNATSTTPTSPGVPEEKIQVGVSRALIEKRKSGVPIISVTSDLPGSTGLGDFQKAFPQDTLDVGVAESNMVSVAAGLSKLGFVPIVDTFAQFGVTKGNLPLFMANLSEAPVIAVFSHTGFQDAADGASHQALSYVAQVSSLAHTELYALTSSDEAHSLLSQAVERFVSQRKRNEIPTQTIFFLGRENFPRHFTDKPDQHYHLGRAQVVRDQILEKAITIVAAGSMLGAALKASELLSQKGIGSIVINPSILNKPDVSTIKAALAKTDYRMVTVEDHYLTGGMSSLLCHALVLEGLSKPIKVKALGVGDGFGRSAYQAEDLYRAHGLDAASIVSACEALVASSPS